MPDRSVVYRLRADITQFRAGMAQASASVKKAADDMTAATKQGADFRAALDDVGGAAGKVGLAAGAGLGAALFAAANFDQAMSGVAAATHESAANMELLRKAAIQAGADTKYSASEAADGIEQLAKAGVTTKDILAGGLSGALNLAAAGGQEVGDAAETAATAMTQFKLAGTDVPHIADLLAAGAGKAQGEVADLAQALKQGGLVAANMGLSIEDTTGTLAAFASAGLLGSDAGTSFKTMIQRLQNPLGNAGKAMDRLGLTVYDAQGNFVGITNIAGQLHDKLGTLTQAQRDAALAQIFGSDAVRAATVLYQQGASGIQGWIDKTNDSGFAADTAKTKMNNLKGDLEQLRGSLETALIGTGEGAQGPLRKLTQGTTEAVNAFGSLPGPAKNATAAVLGLTAVLGGGIWAGTKIVAGVATMRAALTTLGFTAETTRAKLALVGSGSTAAALGIGTLVDTISLMDSSSRSGEAAKATVKSFQDLSDALSYSNVGKYADDLHINLDRLSTDLFENGEKGEYATRIMDQLGESSHGFGAYLNAVGGQVLPFYTANADKASDANKDLGAILDNNKKILGAGAKATGAAATATDSATAATKRNAAAAADQAAAQKKSRAAASATAHAFVGLGKSLSDSKVSLNQWIHQLAAQANALSHFASNAQKAANKGLRQGLIAALEKAGPAGALRMRQLANATDSQITRANAAWLRGQKAIGRYTNAVGGVPAHVGTSLTLYGADKAIAASERVRRTLNSLNGTTAKMYLETIRRERGASARGNIFFYAHGDIANRHQPELAGPGPTRVWREPETQGEAYIPLANDDRRPRAQAIAAATVSLLGGTAYFAGGGITSASRASDDGRAHDTLRQRIKRLTAAIDASAKSIDKEKQARDDLTSKRNELATSVSGNFTTDLFGSRPDNLDLMNPAQRQAALTGGVFSTLKSDIANANTFKSTLATLKKRGLDGQALATLASSGDVARAQAFANLSKNDLGSYETLFNQRAAAATSVGVFAGSSVYGGELHSMNQHLATLVAQNKDLKERLHKLERQRRPIHVHEAHNGKATAKEVARLQRLGA